MQNWDDELRNIMARKMNDLVKRNSNNSSDRNEGNENKTVEIKLRIPGSKLFATEKAKSFEEATGLAAEALRNQLKKFKTKVRNGRI